MAEDYIFILDEEARKFAEENLNETEETRKKSLKALKLWIKENPKLHVKPSDASLLAFLRGCKFNLEKTKKKLTNFYEMKRDRPEWFSNRDPCIPEIKELAELGVFLPLRKTQDNQMVVLIRAGAHDPKYHSFNNVLKTGKMILDVACEANEMAQIYGVMAIFDMGGIGAAHARQLSPTLIQKAVFAWQNYHCRPKRLEFVNAPLYINVVLRVFKSFMSTKLKNRVHVHFGGINALHGVVSKEILPVEYGGSDGKLCDLGRYWYQRLVDHRDQFAEDEKYKAEPYKCDNIGS